jgi:cobalt/nickel transport system permease protein
MHMSDALLSPAVGGALWAAAAGAVAASARRVERDPDQRRVPLMGVLGAFVFAAQMVDFSIPGTGSSGHLAGGLLLAAILGPSAGFLVLAAVLLVQALFFADGGLLALGANVVNVGAASCFVAYPLVFRPLAGARTSGVRLLAGSVLGGVVSLALGSAAVVAETAASGVSSLPAGSFAALVVPIHLAIGAVEGLATAALLRVLWRARPELAPGAAGAQPSPARRATVVALAAAAVAIAGASAWLASTAPDGLEWSLERARGGAAAPAAPEELGRPKRGDDGPGGDLGGAPALLERVQEATAVLRDGGEGAAGSAPDRRAASLAGIAGAGITLGAVLLAFAGLRAVRRRRGVS